MKEISDFRSAIFDLEDCPDTRSKSKIENRRSEITNTLQRNRLMAYMTADE